MANPASIKGKWFDANPNNINRNGRPKSKTRLVIEELEAQGIHGIRQIDVVDIYEQLLDSSRDQLTKIANDETKPMITRIASKQLLAKDWWKITADMLDRVHGKPKQTVANNHSWNLTLWWVLSEIQWLKENN